MIYDKIFVRTSCLITFGISLDIANFGRPMADDRQLFAALFTKIKFKTESFDNTFFIHLNKQNAGVLGWPLKLKSLKVKSIL